eukprot:3335346-Pyramimonas_sp.AAC.1
MVDERELCDRSDMVGSGSDAFLGRGGPARAKYVQSRRQPELARQQHGPTLRAWLQAARWAKHLIEIRAFCCKMVREFLAAGLGFCHGRICLPDYCSPHARAVIHDPARLTAWWQ